MKFTDSVANDCYQGAIERSRWRMLFGNNVLWNWSMLRLALRVYMLSVLLLLLGSKLSRRTAFISLILNLYISVCMHLDSFRPNNPTPNKINLQLITSFPRRLRVPCRDRCALWRIALHCQRECIPMNVSCCWALPSRAHMPLACS
jgi:hypothetical protein